MTPEEFYERSQITDDNMETISYWKNLVIEYLTDAGFDSFNYLVKETRDSIEVDFDDQEAVFYIIDDIRKTQYKELFVVDYKNPVNSKRHTAIFFWLDDVRK
jgi:hypothetical protein